MSMHEIENLVENSTHLIDKSDNLSVTKKRNLLFNLYNFEARYDTGYTHFRCIDILLKYKHTYRLPLEQHPDYSKLNGKLVITHNWIPVYADRPDDASVFYQEADNNLYFDAGDVMWQRLTNEGKNLGEDPDNLSFEQLILTMLKLCEAKKEASLFTEWYAVFCIETVEANNQNFPKWIQQEEILEIRALVESHQSYLTSNEGSHNTKLPSHKSLVDNAITTEEKYIAECLLNFEISLDELSEKYNKWLSSSAHLNEQRIKLVRDHFTNAGWVFELSEEDQKRAGLTFIQPIKPVTEEIKTVIVFLHVTLDYDNNTIIVHLTFKYGMLVKWQGPTEWEDVLALNSHVSTQELSTYLSEEDATSKYLHKKYIGWKLKPDRQLGVHLTHISKMLAIHQKKLVRKYNYAWLAKYLEKSPYLNKAETEFRKMPGKFLVRWHMILLKAFWQFEKGEIDQAKYWANLFLEYIKPIDNFDLDAYRASAQSILDESPKLLDLY